MAFWYFGYGSNMDLRSLRAKGVEPRASERATLRGHRLRFNVHHFFRHEGGVGNIEPTHDPAARVLGVVHLCDDAHLALLDAAEAYGHGYDRVEVSLSTDAGERRAIAYVGIPSFLDDRCLPTQRYLNILVAGATAAGIDAEYVDALRRHAVHQKAPVEPFAPPLADLPTFDAASLAANPRLTALAGFVFDMSNARWQHDFLRGFFGGRDMTLFHLRRLDGSDGTETMSDVLEGRLTPAQRRYLDEYLHEYCREYTLVGRYLVD